MLLEFSLFGVMAIAIVVKWFTTLALRDRREKLTVAYDEQAQAKARLKALVGDVTMSERAIEKLKRHIRSTEHRITKLTKEHDTLQKVASQRAEMDKEKLRLAREAERRRGGG